MALVLPPGRAPTKLKLIYVAKVSTMHLAYKRRMSARIRFAKEKNVYIRREYLRLDI